MVVVLVHFVDQVERVAVLDAIASRRFVEGVLVELQPFVEVLFLHSGTGANHDDVGEVAHTGI